MLKYKIILLCIACFVVSIKAKGQGAYYPAGHIFYNALERFEMKSGNLRNEVFLTAKPVTRQHVANFITSLDTSAINLTAADRYWLQYHAIDNQPWAGNEGLAQSKNPILKHFYRTKANLIQVNEKDFNLFINPVLDFSYGYNSRTNGVNKRFRNTRGIEVRGNIDDKVGFYSYVAENQVAYPTFIKDYIDSNRVVPGEGYIKPFKGGYAQDYFTTRGYITFSPTKHIGVQLGNDVNSIGEGYRSLILSSFAKDYVFLKLNTQIWRIRYQNIFAQMVDFQPTLPKPYPAKFAAFHHLSFDATKFLNIGVFEGVMFFDNKNEGRRFDLSYLNPIILYRSVEHSLGSSDNALAGMDVTILPFKRLKLYGQFMLDELRVHEILSGDGWRGNKFALQAGFKWIDLLGIPNVDWNAEANIIRPYTYSSDTTGKAYAHYSQALAHPLGANLRELANIITVNPYAPLYIRLKHVFIQQGLNTNGINYGSDILMNYARGGVQEYGNSFLQGELTTTQYAEFMASYQLRHNLFIDGMAAWFMSENSTAAIDEMYFSAGLRLNFIHRDLLY